MTRIKIADIKIGKRHRQDCGNLDSLAKSMKKKQLQAIGVDKDHNLIFGFRRIQAALLLGWAEVNADIIDLDDPLQAEHDENVCRKDFTPSEKVAIGQAIEEREAAKAKGRIGTSSKMAKSLPSSNNSLDEAGRSADKAADAVGMSRPTYEKAKEVVAEGTPEDVKEMDESGKVAPTHRKVTNRKKKAESNGEANGTPEPAAEEPNPPEVPRDSIKVPIPEHALPAFEAAKEIGSLCRDIDAIIARVKELGAGPAGRLMHVSSQAQTLSSVRKSIWSSRPTHVCPYCQGKRNICEACKGKDGSATGWTNATYFDQAPEEKRMAMINEGNKHVPF